jgi:hypothetical protein
MYRTALIFTASFVFSGFINVTIWLDRDRTTALMIITALLIRAADISALDDISTPRGCSQISLAHFRITATHPISGSYGRMPRLV